MQVFCQQFIKLIMNYQMQLTLFRRRALRYIFRTKVTRSSDLWENQECTNGGGQIIPLHENALLYNNNICMKDFSGKYTYLQLYENSKRLSRQISNICGSGSSSTVAFFSSLDILTMVILWASWMAGQKALPLNSDMSEDQYNDLVKKSKVSLLISTDLHEKYSKHLAFENSIALIHINHKFLNYNLKAKTLNPTKNSKFSENEFYNNLGAIITHTREKIPELALLTHKELGAKIKNTVESWAVSKDDRILYMCPSSYTYIDENIFNLLVPVSVGGQVHALASFDSKAVWRIILGINVPPNERPNALIAEPKVYQQLIQEYDKMFAGDKRLVEYIRDYCNQNIRFMISSFYRCDPMISSTWLKITGHCLNVSDYSIENLKSKEVDKSSYSKLHIVNAKNNVLLELDGKQTARFPTLSTAIIGRLMVSNHAEIFCCTGEIVSYCNGILKIIGRHTNTCVSPTD